MVEATVLTYPDPKGNFILDTDASGVGLGAVLSQEQDGYERVIGYYSRSLTKSELAFELWRFRGSTWKMDILIWMNILIIQISSHASRRCNKGCACKILSKALHINFVVPAVRDTVNLR